MSTYAARIKKLMETPVTKAELAAFKARPRIVPESIDPIAQFPELQAVHDKLLPGVLKIGRRHTVKVVDFSDASIVYSMHRDESGEGGSTFPEGTLMLGGKKYRVSYNGKVWDGARPWQSGDVPVFDPYAAEVA